MVQASVIMTVRNEARTIEKTILGVAEQLPAGSEIVVVDAGSSDNTPALLENMVMRGLPLRWLEVPGCSRGLGRNIAIERCKNEIVIVIDGGCEPLPGWYQALTEPFLKPDPPDVVGGYWIPTANSAVGRAVGAYTSPSPPTIASRGGNFMPSSRCIAFKKEAWAAVGGYPDENFGEDTYFDESLKQHGFKFLFVPNALVSWAQRETLSGIAKQFFSYGVGSARLGLLDKKKFAYKLGTVAVMLGLCLLSPVTAALAVTVLLASVLYEAKKKSSGFTITAAIVGFVIRVSTLAGEVYGLLGTALRGLERGRQGHKPNRGTPYRADS